MRKQYFKGYYFKCSVGNETIAFIPAFHNDGKENKASLQVITNDGAYSIGYPKIQFGRGKSLEIKMGSNFFSEKGIYLDIDKEDCRIHGKLKFGRLQKVRYDIMGPFWCIPYMQCRHSIISMRHKISGSIMVNQKEYRFQDGMGYIEGDRGCSFPTKYIWTQCHYGNNAIMLSIADIPLLGIHFKGIIGIVLIEGQEYRIATYLGARAFSVTDQRIVIKQGKYTLCVQLMGTRRQRLQAPVEGKMARTIQESVSGTAWYQFSHKDRILLEFMSDNASFEYELKTQ